MASNMEQSDVKIFREHSPYIQLLSKIPSRVHRGMVGYDLNLTCIAVHPKFLALGTNAGLVYWYDRGQDILQRLWCSNRRIPITKVCLVETVDLMLAVGNQDGCVTIFQIPRPLDKTIHPPLLRQTSESLTGANGEGLELFTIPGLHTKPIKALAWSKNGMKLFSGDDMGQVSLTEIDFVARTTSSIPLCKEGFRITQLSYSKPYLMISTTERSVVIDTAKSDLEPLVVGERLRKVYGPYGGIIWPSTSKSVNLMAVRPKNTFYAASVSKDQCKVDSTILLESSLKRPHLDIPLINPMVFTHDIGIEDDIHLLEPLLHEDGVSTYFVGYNANILHIIDPKKPMVLASCSSLRGILDLSTCSGSGSDKINHDEIFILEGPRSVVRLSLAPDPFHAELLDTTVNPLGTDETEGVGLESVGPNLASMTDSVVSKLPYFGANSLAASAGSAISNFGGKLFSSPSTEPDVEEAQEIRSDLEDDKKDLESLFGDDNDDESGGYRGSFQTLSLQLVSPDPDSSNSPISTEPDPQKEKSLLDKLKIGSYFSPTKPEGDSSEPVKDEVKVVLCLEPLSGSQYWQSFNFIEPYISRVEVHGQQIMAICANSTLYEGILDHDKIHWKKLSYEASDISVSDNGAIIWTVCNGKAYSMEDPMQNDFVEITSQAKWVRVTDKFGVVLKLDGTLDIYLDIHKPTLLLQRSERLKFDGHISSLSVVENLMTVVSNGFLYLRSGLSASNNALGTSWTLARNLKVQVEHVTLYSNASRQKMLVTTTDNEVYFCQGDLANKDFNPQWIQISVYGCSIDIDESLKVSMSNSMIVVADPASGAGVISQEMVSGSYWETIQFDQIKSRIKEIQANGIFELEGVLWVVMFSLKPNVNELFFTKFHDQSLHQVPLPRELDCPITSIAASPEACWLLSSKGDIFIRTDIRPILPEGADWLKLDMTQLVGTTKLEHIAMGTDVIWALDSNGQVWLRLGSVGPNEVIPAWVALEDSDLKLARIASSSSIHMVWAIDTDQRVVVREGIYPDFRHGAAWTHVDGVERVVDIIASHAYIWVLTQDGSFFRRSGITEANVRGEFWEMVSLHSHTLTSVSVTVCDKPFALDKRGRIIALNDVEICLSD
ncbi:hypothetical protein TCAL_12625 [Tigriopus californicus]|uniref:Uncharacterized protein n=1 Tax=Tigriopus californicus TaxID=6832 RepID=A0A553PPK9_TIGCA|nr:uncharacterized protein LOC131882058 [Tigriopus californicus]TRY79613.1 hypothetical protein TCAL_12625 [Tigriopus californicus]|eukprot:TCALIF_12625-PA protein Name:"Similar to CG11141 WD repeat-containing protein CG11141 (Drosophila melanogaster)" AED:0.01 eAED:0.01 QI:595/1/1/1/0.75/0.6/5/192/1115